MKILLSFLLFLVLCGVGYFVFRQTDFTPINAFPLKQLIFAFIALAFSGIIFGLHYFERECKKENQARIAILISLFFIGIFLYSLGISISRIKAWVPTGLLRYQEVCEGADCQIGLSPFDQYLLLALGLFCAAIANALLLYSKMKWLSGNVGARLTFVYDFILWIFCLEIFIVSYRSEKTLLFLNAFLLSYISVFLVTAYLIPLRPKLEAKKHDAEEKKSSKEAEIFGNKPEPAGGEKKK